LEQKCHDQYTSYLSSHQSRSLFINVGSRGIWISYLELEQWVKTLGEGLGGARVGGGGRGLRPEGRLTSQSCGRSRARRHWPPSAELRSGGGGRRCRTSGFQGGPVRWGLIWFWVAWACVKECATSRVLPEHFRWEWLQGALAMYNNNILAMLCRINAEVDEKERWKKVYLLLAKI
jgi:hypothetical protein